MPELPKKSSFVDLRRKYRSAWVLVTIALFLVLPLSVGAQDVSYEGDVLPSAATPAWLGGPTGLVVADAAADGGFALEMATFGSMSWFIQGLPLVAMDNAQGWFLEIRHLALSNSGGTLELDQPNDDTDHLRISDGQLILFLDFRPLEARVSSDSFVGPCSSLPMFCSFYELAAAEYLTVRISAQGNSFVAKVGDLPAFHGQKSPEPAGGKFISFGNGSSSQPKSSLARWDYIRLNTAGPEMPVVIDVKPGSFPNSVNPKSKGVVPVAILSTSVLGGDVSDFDATEIDPFTVQFGPDLAEIAHASGHFEDVDSDGNLDLILHFRIQDTGIGCGNQLATLSGFTFDGMPVLGADSIKASGCK